MNLGNKLIELRKQKNLSQEEVAEKLGVTRQTISKWETNQSTPDFDKIVPICKLYNIETEELLTGNKKETDNENNKIVCDYANNKKKRAKVICISIFLFFLALAWIIVTSEVLMSDSVIVVGFFLFIILGVINLIYNLSDIPASEEKIVKKINKKKIHKYDDIISILFTLIYLSVSFITGAWHITWLIWIIYALVCEIVHVALKNDEGDK